MEYGNIVKCRGCGTTFATEHWTQTLCAVCLSDCIVMAEIRECNDPSANGNAEIYGITSQGRAVEVSYYDDELHLSADAVIGMTEEQAWRYKCNADIAYLQS